MNKMLYLRYWIAEVQLSAIARTNGTVQLNTTAISTGDKLVSFTSPSSHTNTFHDE